MAVPGQTVHRSGSIMKLLMALAPSGLMLSWFLQPLSARKGCAPLKEQTDDVPKTWYQGWFIFTHSTVPTGIYTNCRSLKAFFPVGIYTKLRISESSFPTNYINILLSNSVRGKYFFPHFTCTGVCSPVIALSTHTGLCIPVHSPLNYNLKGLKQRCAF